MLEVIAYFAISYIVVINFARLLLRRLSKRNVALNTLSRGAIVSLFLIAPFMPYIFVYVQTIMVSKQIYPSIAPSLIDYGFIPKIRKYMVLSFSNNRADVYVVTVCHEADKKTPLSWVGVDIHYIKSERGWQPDGPAQEVWSDCGNTDGNIFPPDPAGGFLH